MRLFVGDDHVHVVLTAQAVVRHAQQAVRIRRKIDARDFGALVADNIEKAGILVGEAVVILTPDERSDQQVERRDRSAPVEFELRLLQPFRMLVVHGVDDVGERLVRIEQPVASSQQITFEPAFQRVFAEHLHHAAVGRDVGAVGVFRLDLGEPCLQTCFIDVLQPVGRVLVRG